MMGRAGSQGPYISFLYFCSPISHQLQMPIATKVIILPSMTPAIQALRPPPVNVANTAPPAVVTNATVKAMLPFRDFARSCRRNMGKRPNTSIENNVSEKTCVVDGNREASTVDAISAELVEMEAGKLPKIRPRLSNRSIEHSLSTTATSVVEECNIRE
jgi:hypothetical protein